MKKILSVILFCILTSLAFSKSVSATDFFSRRIVELKVDVPVNISNNAFSLFDFLKKDVVIDLRKIAEEMPMNGFIGSLRMSPSVALNLNISDKFHLGTQSGIDGYGDIRLGKGLFDFLGFGNVLYQDMLVTGSFNADIFAYTNISTNLKIAKFRIGITPNLFMPILHMDSRDSLIKISNTKEGLLGFDFTANLNVYSLTDDYSGLFKDFENLKQKFLTSFGLDLEGYIGWEFSKTLTLDLNYRVPIIPGRLYSRTIRTAKAGFEVSILNMGNEDLKLTPSFTDSDPELALYYTNRPLKANLAATWKPFGNGFYFIGSGGVGVKYPFTGDFMFYPEYQLGVKLNLIGIVTAQLSTEYKDEIFYNKLMASVSCRIIQLDLGLEMSSTDFIKSFQGTGFGVQVAVSIGF